jgi:hypothetical protein
MSEQPKKIRLTAAEMSKLREILLPSGAGSKIEAIKHVRQASLHLVETDTGGVTSGVGLREAKDAVEDYMHRMGMAEQRNPAPYAVIIPHQPIRRIVCDFGEGELELDLEGMSLRILSDMGSARIEDITSLLDLHKRVRDWEAEVSGGERS